jgi:ATP-dependent DNA helicase RecG
LTIVEVTLTDDSGMCVLSFFNQPWLANQLQPGTQLVCQGVMEHYRDYRRMSSPLHTVLEQDASSGQIQPVYRANSDISIGWLKRLISEALASCARGLDPLPPTLRIRYKLMDRRSALTQVHNPETMDDCQAARRRLAFDEIFFLQLYMQIRKAKLQALSDTIALNTNGAKLSQLASVLPFTLTDDQSIAVSEILSDLANPVAMNRLLMGDVGSGKTVVALHAIVAAADSGVQSAMMAPTEVLAIQYATQLGPYLDQLNISWALLTSAVSASERAEKLDALSSGSLQVLFGTHALIEPDVQFANLALVIVDEQHRFGVNQRDTLRQKGNGVHYLAMTATPIPRSQALTIYGDLDLSLIKTRPHVGVKTTTKLLDRSQIGLAYDTLRLALSRGEQGFIVCPLIGESLKSAPSDAMSDDEITEPELISEFYHGDENLAAAKREYEYLSRQVFPNHKVALLTSKLSAAEKRSVMEEFRAGRIDILVSTTVIEVGIDVPNATVMIIMDAERFGLSQLHQLRGRVGRGQHEGIAFLISASSSDQALQRLTILENSNDGFKLAEADLRMRNEGDVLGIRQHGGGRLRLVQVVRDQAMIEVAHRAAKQLLEQDPHLSLPEHALLAWELELRWNDS